MKSKLWIYGRDFFGTAEKFISSYSGPFPKILLDSNVSGRYSLYSKIVNCLPGDKITVFAEIEQAVNNNSRIQNSKFEILPNDDEINNLKLILLSEYKRLFNEQMIMKHFNYINSIPSLKNKSKLEKVICLINHYQDHNSKSSINFHLLLCMLNISINCDPKARFKKLLHYPQERYSFELVKNILFDLFIIEEVNRFIDDGDNVFFCTNDSGAAFYANYIKKLTLCISLYNLHQEPSKNELYGIEKEIYLTLLKHNQLYEIISRIRDAVYKEWGGDYKTKYIFQLTPIADAIDKHLRPRKS